MKEEANEVSDGLRLPSVVGNIDPLLSWHGELTNLFLVADSRDVQREFEVIQSYLHSRTRLTGLRWAMEKGHGKAVQTLQDTNAQALESVRYLLAFDEAHFGRKLIDGMGSDFMEQLREWFSSNRVEFGRHLDAIRQVFSFSK